MEGFYYLGERVWNAYGARACGSVKEAPRLGEEGAHKGIRPVGLGEAAGSRGQDSNRKDPKAFT